MWIKRRKNKSSSYLSCALWSVCEATDTGLHLTTWTSSSPARSWKHTQFICIVGLWVEACARSLIFIRPQVMKNSFPVAAYSPFSLDIFCVEGKHLNTKKDVNWWEFKKHTFVHTPDTRRGFGLAGVPPVRPSAGYRSERRGWTEPAEPPSRSWSWNRWRRTFWERLSPRSHPLYLNTKQQQSPFFFSVRFKSDFFKCFFFILVSNLLTSCAIIFSLHPWFFSLLPEWKKKSKLIANVKKSLTNTKRDAFSDH